MKDSAAEAMLKSGVSPLQLVCNKVLSCRDGRRAGTFTELRINSLELGTLCPAQYRVITNRNNQSLRLSSWAFQRVAEISQNREATEGWTSFYIPAKALMRDYLRKLLESRSKKGSCDFSSLVAEVSSELLYEDAAEASEKMHRLRTEYGVRFLLSEFGDEFCPVLRLSSYPVDFVLLDPSADSSQVSGVCADIAHGRGIKVIERRQSKAAGAGSNTAADYYIQDKSGEEQEVL